MKKTIILGHENPDVDSIVSGALLEKVYRKLNYDVDFIIPDDEIDLESANICMKYGLNPYRYQAKITQEDHDFILVDHHQREVNGKVIQIIDHHPTTENFEHIPCYQNENISSASMLILREYEDLLDKEDVRLACLAAFIDTASFHSTKGKKSDKFLIQELCQKYEIDYDDLYQTGLCLTDISDLQKVSLNGLKKYNYHGNLVESSYIQVKDIHQCSEEIFVILDLLLDEIIKKNLELFVFIVHDMTEFKTTIFRVYKDGWIKKKYDQYVSRGSTIMPEIEALLSSQKVKEKQL